MMQSPALPGESSSQIDPQPQRRADEVVADLGPVWAAVGRVQLRLRLQAALRALVYGLLLGTTLLLGTLLLVKLHLLPSLAARWACFGGLGLGLLAALAWALRPISALQVAARIDKSHQLNDRLASALQFARRSQEEPSRVTGLLQTMAMVDAARAAQGISPSVAAPWQRPLHLPLLLGLLGLTGVVWWIRLPAPKSKPEQSRSVLPSDGPRLLVEPELLAPEKDELQRLLDDAKRQGDAETAAILKQMQELLAQVERGELSRKEAFDRLSELEQRLMQGKDGTLEELQQRLRKAGSELGESKLAKELSQAMIKEDLEKAQKELQKLAQQALDRARGAQAQKDKQALAQAFEQAARALSRPDKNAKPEDKNDPQRQAEKQKDQWKEQTRSEEQTRKLQQLREEERSLKKKLQENPQDQDTQRRLKQKQRELEQLEQQVRQQEKERQEAQRELEQLERDLQKAAAEMQKQLEKMTPEQRQALEKLAQDMNRMQDEIRKLQKQQKGRGQAMMAVGSIKQVLRRVA
ncbi:MAG TPA: hypothetical protein PLA87_04500, partial [Pseudomonadota bacterium]|nr:hypothetical protein [Pseudomonadota bacterium]